MKTFTLSLLLFCVSIFCNAQYTYYKDDFPNLIDLTGTLYYADGKFGDENSAALLLGSKHVALTCDILCELEEGEIILFTNLNIEATELDSTYHIEIFGPDENGVLISQDESAISLVIDKNTRVVKADETTSVICSVYTSTVMTDLTDEDIYDCFDSYYSENTQYCYIYDSLISDETIYQYSFCIQKIGLIESFELRPVDRYTYDDLDDYFSIKSFTSESNLSEIIMSLANDIECLATDSYGQEIILMCPTYTWSIDKKTGIATYTPLFTPRLTKTEWVSGNPIECSFTSGTATTKSLLLWENTSISNTKNDNFLVTGGEGEILIFNNPGATIYDIAGRLIYKGTDTIINVPEGIYIIVTEKQTEKIFVR